MNVVEKRIPNQLVILPDFSEGSGREDVAARIAASERIAGEIKQWAETNGYACEVHRHKRAQSFTVTAMDVKVIAALEQVINAGEEIQGANASPGAGFAMGFGSDSGAFRS